MRNWVNEWRQDGRLCIWRYAETGRNWRGWHFSGDPAGCRSIRSLLNRMCGGEACFRTLRLAPVTDAILCVPNAGRKIEPCFEKLRISYLPASNGLELSPEDGILRMTVGGHRIHELSAAFASVERGGGDFGIYASDNRKPDYWMFWWMPDINYYLENRK